MAGLESIGCRSRCWGLADLLLAAGRRRPAAIEQRFLCRWFDVGRRQRRALPDSPTAGAAIGFTCGMRGFSGAEAAAGGVMAGDFSAAPWRCPGGSLTGAMVAKWRFGGIARFAVLPVSIMAQTIDQMAERRMHRFEADHWVRTRSRLKIIDGRRRVNRRLERDLQ